MILYVFYGCKRSIKPSRYAHYNRWCISRDYDYLPAIYEKLGASVLFNKVAMRPGSVTTVAQLNGKLLFGLSGNPSACYVGFELFVRPCIRTYMFSEKHM